MDQTKQPKLTVEQVFERFQAFAKDLFKDIAEPQSLVLVVDWRIGQNDFPAGLLVTRGEYIEPGELLRVIQQTVRMTLRMQQLYLKAIQEEQARHEQSAGPSGPSATPKTAAG